MQRTGIHPQKALALGLITNELVTYSIKYAFDENDVGTIFIGLDRDENGLVRLRVRDDGCGCAEGTRPGTGTELVSALVKQHNGTYTRVNGERGCEVTVTLVAANPSA